MSLPDRIVSRGTIRVDARRAVEQLRGHQLLDQNLYALEALRFAVASGATRIEVTHRRDGLTLQWDGSRLSVESLERLMDHLLIDSDQAELRRPRWLAYAVNAALGLKPDWVEVHTCSDGECAAVRWTRNSGAGSPPEVRLTTPPDHMPPCGMRMEIRRRAGWLARLLSSQDLPLELQAMQDSTWMLGDTLLLDGQPFPRPPRPRPLLRVPFTLSCARSCFVELTQWQDAAPVLEWLEQGVRLASSRWSAPPPLPCVPHAGCDLPVRVVVEAEELDTNASRSAIRQDSRLLQELPAAAAEAFYAALHALASKVIGMPCPESGVLFLTEDSVELEDALGAIACVIAGSKEHGAMPDKLREWLELPLLRDAVGRPLPLAPYVGPGVPFEARYGEAAWRDELAPWLDNVVWLRGRTAERAIDSSRIRPADHRYERARKALRRKERFHTLPVREPGTRLEIGRGQASVCRSFTEEPWAGLKLEVALRAADGSAPFKVHAVVDGRSLQSLELDAAQFPLPMEAAVEWEGRLLPRADFDGVERSAWLDRALWLAAIEGVRLADELAAGVPAMDVSEAQRLRPILIAAVETFTRCTRALDLSGRADPGTLQSMQGLWNAAFWPSSDGGFVSTAAIVEYARRTGAVCLSSSAKGPAADGRPVLVAKESALSWVGPAANRDVEFVTYDAAIATLSGPDRDAARRAEVDRISSRELRADRPPIWMRFARPGVIGRIAVHERNLLTRIHAGQVLSSSDMTPELAPVLLTVDDDSIVPRASWIGTLHFGDNPEIDRDIQLAFAEVVVGCLEGGACPPELEGVASSPEQASPELVAWLLQAVHRSYLSMEHGQLRARIETLPILRVLDEGGLPVPASLYWIRGWHPVAAIPFLLEPPGFATLDWRPVIAPRGPILAALRELLDSRLMDATGELAERARQAREERQWEEWDRRPLVDPADVIGRLPGSPVAFARVASDSGREGQTIAAALCARPPALVRVLFRNREVCQFVWPDWDLPLSITIGLNDRAHLSASGELSVPGLEAVSRLALHARVLLATEIVRSPPSGGLLESPQLLPLIAAAVRFPLPSPDERSAELHSLLRKTPWPTAQGGTEEIGALREGPGGLPYSTIRFAPWHGPAAAPSDLDSPVAWIPPGAEGDNALLLLRYLHGTVEDVTGMLSALQARRAGAGAGPPRLPGTPAHPALRKPLHALGVSMAEGEIELVDGALELLVMDLAGGVQSVPWGFGIPVRVVARIDDMLTEERAGTLRDELSRAAYSLLCSSHEHLDELPTFVRAIARKLICGKLSRVEELDPSELGAPVFPDAAGGWHSVRELSDTGRSWPFTTDPPPYPSGGTVVVLCLSGEETGALRTKIDLRDQTHLLRRLQAGALKQQQAPAESIGIHGNLRSRCLFVAQIATDELQGEVGLLAPEFADSRSIEVYVGRRPLCSLRDELGYPVAAAVNCDALPANRYFDAPRTTAAGGKLAAQVVAIAALEARRRLLSSRRAAAARLVEVTLNPEPPLGTMRLIGVFWLPEQWPSAPQTSVRSTLGSSTEPLRISAPHESIDGILPVCAELCVYHEGFERSANPAPFAWRQDQVLRRLALQALREMLAEAAAALPPAELESWQWNLVLLGDRIEGLSAACLDGSRLDALQVFDILRSGDRLAIASPSTLPTAATAPVLADDGSAASRVLRARARKGLGELGEPPSAPARSVSESWLRSLGTLLTAALSGEKTQPQGPLEADVVRALQRTLQGLNLTGSPVRAVRTATRGRPVRYRDSDGTLLVNTGHASIRACLALPPESALALIGAAAVAEINRELPYVTDWEEAGALGDLLRQLAGGSRAQ